MRVGYVDRTPYKRATETVVKLSRETARSRRLDADLDDESKLLAACDSHLRAIVEYALETGVRRGEILSLRWSEVEGLKVDGTKVTWAPRSEIVLLAARTKTRRSRRIPISTRLRGILELRRFDPAGQPHAFDAYVFGSAIGQRVQSTKRAWTSAVLKAHGEKPSYTATMNVTPESRATLQAINLHFHDLRREAGSRWLDGGVPLHTVRDWLGHTNISQTSNLLVGHPADPARRHEGLRGRLATDCNGGRDRGAKGAKVGRRAEGRVQ